MMTLSMFVGSSTLQDILTLVVVPIIRCHHSNFHTISSHEWLHYDEDSDIILVLQAVHDVVTVLKCMAQIALSKFKISWGIPPDPLA